MSKAFLEKKIDDATATEVRSFAASFLGIPTEGQTDDQVRAAVRAATETDVIYVRLEPEAMVGHDQTGHPPLPPVVATSDEEPVKLQGGLGRGDPKVRIVLHNEEKDGVIVSRHKEVGVNGVVWLLKRGEPIDIPYRVYLALNNANRDVITHNGEGEVMTQSVKNTPFNIEAMPSRDEIAAWEARTASQFMAA